MKTVTINFTGGKPFSLRMPDEAATELINALTADGYGTTHITSDAGLLCVVNRAQITYVEAA